MADATDLSLWLGGLFSHLHVADGHCAITENDVAGHSWGCGVVDVPHLPRHSYQLDMVSRSSNPDS